MINKLQVERLSVGEVQYAITDTAKPAKRIEVGIIKTRGTQIVTY